MIAARPKAWGKSLRRLNRAGCDPSLLKATTHLPLQREGGRGIRKCAKQRMARNAEPKWRGNQTVTNRLSFNALCFPESDWLVDECSARMEFAQIVMASGRERREKGFYATLNQICSSDILPGTPKRRKTSRSLVYEAPFLIN